MNDDPIEDTLLCLQIHLVQEGQYGDEVKNAETWQWI